MRQLFANWKMYLNHEESVELAKYVASSIDGKEGVKITVFPSTLSFTAVHDVCHETDISLGGQNVAWVPKGAYTGAVSAALMSDAGAEYVLVGHSERRYIFGEDSEAVRKKLEAVLDAGLTAILCVGETKEDREADKANYRIQKQLMALEGLDIPEGKLLLAYEPVWAIAGHGDVEPCTVKDVAEMHAMIKETLTQYTAVSVPLLFGGSVNAENALAYHSLEDVDGLLVGSASSTKEGLTALIDVLAA